MVEIPSRYTKAVLLSFNITRAGYYADVVRPTCMKHLARVNWRRENDEKRKMYSEPNTLAPRCMYIKTSSVSNAETFANVYAEIDPDVFIIDTNTIAAATTRTELCSSYDINFISNLENARRDDNDV